MPNPSTADDRVVYAWGNGRNEPDWLREIVKEPFCIDLGKRDVPKHPLFLPKNSQKLKPLWNNILRFKSNERTNG